VDSLVGLGIIPSQDGSFTPGTARATRIIKDLERSGLPLDGIANAVKAGELDFGMFDLDNYDRISALTPETFRQVAERTGIPVELLLVIREAIGFAVAEPDDRVREDEIEVIPLVQSGLAGGMPAATVERILRVFGESLRRLVETESEAWMTHVVGPLIAQGIPPQQVFEMASKFGEANLPSVDQAMLAIHHGQQDHVWTAGTYNFVEAALERTGLRAKVTRPPAMSFVDLSGFTRLTDQRGDEAAAEMASTLSNLVQRSAHEHGGRVVKRLGDGVMLFFNRPAGALISSLDMAERVPAAGLPQAHIGVDAGPVIVQDGDYFGSTVNVASRIAGYARAGEVLASDRALQAAGELPDGIRAQSLGPVDLKGIAEPVPLERIERLA
jgi:adenylate cyclase